MMDITLKVNGLDLSGKLSTYSTAKKVSYSEIVTGLDNTEYPFPGVTKTEITFSLFPMTDEESAELYSAICGLVFQATYTDQMGGGDVAKRVRVASDLESAFLLKSIDGKRRYKGGSIVLREL